MSDYALLHFYGDSERDCALFPNPTFSTKPTDYPGPTRNPDAFLAEAQLSGASHVDAGLAEPVPVPTWQFPSAHAVLPPARFSCGADGVGTVDPMVVACFDAYFDLSAGPEVEMEACRSAPVEEMEVEEPVDCFLEEEEDIAPSDDEDSASDYEEVVRSRPTPRAQSHKGKKLPSSGPTRSNVATQRQTARVRASPALGSRHNRAGPSESPSAPAQRIPHAAVQRAKDAGATLPPTASSIAPQFHYMLLLGCRPVPSNTAYMTCHIPGACDQRGVHKRAHDMARHVESHFREELALCCTGCPLTFARDDSLARHLAIRRDCKDASPERVAMIEEFNALPEVEMIRKADAEAKMEGKRNGNSSRKLGDMWYRFLKEACVV
ncbi:hypothetical protein MKEN_00536800 [Mycena kentingensis (nom. inval.)]|nr:hypothetical protein MKEN_00536800 [Mycena kentingensis (nom. inval.)]